MKSIVYLFFSVLLSTAASAQVTCRDSIYQEPHKVTKTLCEQETIPSVCYNSTIVKYDSCYDVKKRFLFFTYYTTECKTFYKSEITPYSCKKDTIICRDTAYIEYTDTTVQVCDTIRTSIVNGGLWGNDDVTQKRIDALRPLNPKGWNIRFSWSLYEPVQGQYNHAYLDEQFDLCEKNGLDIGFMMFVGDNAPKWIYETVPAVKTTDGGVYPYYKDPDYDRYVKAMQKDIADHIKNRKIKFWMSAEGSTGDIGDKGGYKGDPLDAQYAISRDWWISYRHNSWLYLASIYTGNLLVNPGNNLQDLAWLQANMPDIWGIKQGGFTHGINQTNELSQAQGVKDFTGAIRGEFEGRDRADTSWRPACATDITLLFAYVGGDILNVAPNKASYPGFLLANTYCGTDSSFWYPHNAKSGTILERGIWWDDSGTDIITGPYFRNINLTGGVFGYRDGTGQEMFGRYYWTGTGTVSTSKATRKLRVWYRDGTGSIQLGSKLLKGTNTGQQLYADFSVENNTAEIKTDLKIFLLEGK